MVKDKVRFIVKKIGGGYGVYDIKKKSFVKVRFKDEKPTKLRAINLNRLNKCDFSPLEKPTLLS